ncbi:MAG: 6,7-dimethyl-8-ribityllumazine synthase [Planctomycetota bacterium]
MQELAGNITGRGRRIAIAAARFNSNIVERLIEGCLDGLLRHEVADEAITVARCPGSWELPLLCRRLARSERFDAVIALGCIIRGDTPHFDYVAAECAKGVAHVGMEVDLPITFGVLTTDTVDQAMNRAGIKHGNKGFDAALGTLEMIALLEAV